MIATVVGCTLGPGGDPGDPADGGAGTPGDPDASAGSDASGADGSGADGATTRDAGLDSSTDAGTDAGMDAGTDAGDDAGTDAGDGDSGGGDPNPERILTGLGAPEMIAIDATNIYFTDPGAGTVVQMDKTTLASTVLASGQGKPWHVAVDDTYVYWSATTDVAIRRVPIGGGVAPTLLYGNPASAITVDATTIYWSGGGGLYRAPKDGSGAPVKLPVDGHCIFGNELFVVGSLIVWWGQNPGFFKCTFNPSTGVTTEVVYDTNGESGLGVSPTVNSRTRRTLGNYVLTGAPAGDITGPAKYIATDPTLAAPATVWWTNGATKIGRFAAGDAAETIITSAAVKANHLVVDATHLYWTDTSFIGRVPR